MRWEAGDEPPELWHGLIFKSSRVCPHLPGGIPFQASRRFEHRHQLTSAQKVTDSNFGPDIGHSFSGVLLSPSRKFQNSISN
jgi:hypothetical protein